MNKKTVAIAVVAGVATIAIVAAISGSKSSSLPLPQTVSLQQASASRQGSGSHAGGGSNSTPPSGSGVTTTTFPTLTACSISLNNPTPVRSETGEIATVTVVPAAPGVLVTVVGQYPHRPVSHTGQTGVNGVVAVNFPIGHVPLGTAISFTASARLKGKPVTCAPVSTSPVA